MRGLALAMFALGLAGCGGKAGPSPSSTPGAAPIPGLTVAPSVSARVVVSGLQTPDDIGVAPDGTVYVSDESRGELSAWTPATGQVRLVAGALSHPEGIVALDGLLVVCEQGKNQLTRVDPHDGSVAPFRAFVRPDGALLVADEDAGDVVLLRADGTSQTLVSGLNAPDDVLGDDQGNVYVNTVGDGVLHRLQGTEDQPLITGLDSTHGLAFDLDGNVLVTDLGGGGRLVKVFVR